MKLRTNANIENLSHCFGVSCATISRILNKWLPHIDTRLHGLILREVLQKTIPQSFQRSFGKKVAVILDYFEVYIERPSNLRARASTWSNYEHHNIAEVFLGVTPQGVIFFASECCNGVGVYVMCTLQNTGILKNCCHRILFLLIMVLTLLILWALCKPNFIYKEQSQLSALEVEETRKIANVQVRVEHVIGSVKQKFILQSTIPIQYVTKQKDWNTPLIDHIIRVCCELTNLCDSVVPFD